MQLHQSTMDDSKSDREVADNTNLLFPKSNFLLALQRLKKCRVDLRVSIISSYQGWIDINWSNVNMASTNQISFRQAKKRSK